MPLSFTGFVDGDTVSASEIKSQLDSIEEFVNEDISSSDLTSSTKWIKRELLYKPEFYGSPSPRAEMVTGNTYHRQTPFGIPDQAHFHHEINLNAQAVHGLSATFKVPRDNCVVSVFCNFWAYESAGTVDRDAPTNAAQVGSTSVVALIEGDAQKAAVFTLRFDDGGLSSDDEDGTHRYLYLASDKNESWIDNLSTSSTPYRIPFSANYISRKNISMICQKTMSKGVHSVAVYCKPLVASSSGASPFGGRIAVDVRSMVVDVHSNYQSS